MNWYTWPSKSAFDAWHLQVCNGLGIPYANKNTSTGQIDPNAQWTLRYTDVYEIGADDWRALVHQDIATTYTIGLGEPSSPPPNPFEAL